MAYVTPKDFSQDPGILEKVMKTLGGDLELTWMENIRERLSARPSHATRGLTLDDINRGGYGPDRIPELVRHNFSMAPRGAILPPGLPSLGYRINRKSEVWSDLAPRIYEEGKSRRWAPSRDVPWSALDESGLSEAEELAWRQLATTLCSIGLVAADVPARWVWLTNQEFHEVKYLLCLQMIDATRLAEAFRKRALYATGSLGTDFRELGELLKMVFESGSYPCASASMNLLLFSWVQGLCRQLGWTARNAADTFLAGRAAQDATRFIAYGVDHVRSLLRVRPAERETLNGHLDLLENGLAGLLGAREFFEPLALLSGGPRGAADFTARTWREYRERCEAAGLGDRSDRSPIPHLLELLREPGDEQ
jgi:hypothetical protein